MLVISVIIGVSPRRRSFHPRHHYFGLTVKEVAMLYTFIQVLPFSPVSTIPQTICTHSLIYHLRWATILQSVKRLPTGCTVWGSNLGGGARFSAPVQTSSGANPASYAMGTGSFPGVKRLGRDIDHPTTSSADVKERV